ncbi:hypothetical protein RM697_01505 [Ichthyenterobacterium sp. W332]|uniref:Periplasmic heavy metal sensor n=1 Tax=Microcosmobacter mediterraneus TaxID=3075607 RepID=A0ABU2YGK2_9FLAO|nr:hypothetical protein [Ichthyenterobacterium sp. W332]MDT0557303.1 hypothetical protein [Ichthyenterobacterium sp. W332]
MKKNSLIYSLLAFLVIANGFFLFHFVKGPKKRDQKPELFMVKQLDFNDNQLEEYKIISDLHFEKMKTTSKAIRSLKDQLFTKVSNANIESNFIDSITTLIGNYEKDKDYELFFHLQKVRSICNDKQKEKFEAIMKKTLKRGERQKRRH